MLFGYAVFKPFLMASLSFQPFSCMRCWRLGGTGLPVLFRPMLATKNRQSGQVEKRRTGRLFDTIMLQGPAGRSTGKPVPILPITSIGGVGISDGVSALESLPSCRLMRAQATMQNKGRIGGG